jgi:hypothetical protein
MPLRTLRRIVLLGGVLVLTPLVSAVAADEPSLIGKHVVGYQGWFGCPDDKGTNRWVHWFRGQQSTSGTELTVDLWPDVSELAADERCKTGLKLSNGQPAEAFSSANPKTVRRHFKWLKEYGIDGAVLERFASELRTPDRAVRPDIVLANVRSAAEAEGRGFMVMYDLSGMPDGSIVQTVKDDWIRLGRTVKVTESPNYMRHRNKPIVALWGVGFTHVKLTALEARDLLAFFKSQEVTLLGGVPSRWRTLQLDARPDLDWKEIYQQFDILSPWTVGRFANPTDAKSFARTVMAEDIKAARESGQDYLPVVFPGFSWHNLMKGKSPRDLIPRLCGAFYEAQVRNALSAGAKMIFTAMFDEVDEGTAIFKIVRRSAELPVETTLLAPDQSGCDPASDLYLRLAGAAKRDLRRAVGK